MRDNNPIRSVSVDRSEQFADYIIKNQCTVRVAAAHFSISKSTVHKDITRRLREINYGKYVEVKEIIEKNKSERHLRGGMATKRKYENMRTKREE